jgi:hypothetical protein
VEDKGGHVKILRTELDKAVAEAWKSTAEAHIGSIEDAQDKVTYAKAFEAAGETFKKHVYNLISGEKLTGAEADGINRNWEKYVKKADKTPLSDIIR